MIHFLSLLSLFLDPTISDFAALSVMGIRNTEVMSIFQLVAGILHIGNIQFVENGNYSQIEDEESESHVLGFIESLEKRFAYFPKTMINFFSKHRSRISGALARNLRRTFVPQINVEDIRFEVGKQVRKRRRYSER